MDTLDRIIYLLKGRGLQQKDLTDYLGVDKSTFSQWKKGSNQSYNKYISKIAEFLGTTPDYLYGWTDDPINYEDTEENIDAPLDVIEYFDGDAEKIYEFQKVVEQDYYLEEQEDMIMSQIQLIARHLADVPKEDREQLIKNFGQTIDIYLKAKGIKTTEE